MSHSTREGIHEENHRETRMPVNITLIIMIGVLVFFVMIGVTQYLWNETLPRFWPNTMPTLGYMDVLLLIALVWSVSFFFSGGKGRFVF